MANQEHVEILLQGVEIWNRWKEENPRIEVDLSEHDFSNANLMGINLIRAKLRDSIFDNSDLSEAYLNFASLNHASLVNANLYRATIEGTTFEAANLSNANLSSVFAFPQRILNGLGHSVSYFREAKFIRANLSESHFYGAYFESADFSFAMIKNADISNCGFNNANFEAANLSGSDIGNASMRNANLTNANLQGVILTNADLAGCKMMGADLLGANLLGADLQGCNLTGASLNNANLNNVRLVDAEVGEAIFSGCSVYGASIWDLRGDILEQKDLVITNSGKPIITVDNIKVAQFIYLILNNEEIKHVIDTLTSKTVLILGRFTPERKSILDALRNKLRELNLLPILFDFDRPVDKDFTETIKTLAGLCLFIIADITNPKSSPLELQSTIPDYQTPFVPIIQEGESPFSMMADLQSKYNWVLDTCSYDSEETLIKALERGIIEPALKKHAELRLAKAQSTKVISLKSFL